LENTISFFKELCLYFFAVLIYSDIA